ASIGSVATPIGTPPNLLLKGFVRDSYGIDIGFAQWMAFGLPLVAVMLPLGWLLLTRMLFRLPRQPLAGGRDVIRRELSSLGPTSREEWTVFGVFSFTALAWIVREPLAGWEFALGRLPALQNLDDAGIAVLAVLALFIIPVRVRRGVFLLDWGVAKEIPWGLLLLFGGGLSLAAGIQANGVDGWIGDRIGGIGYLPLLVLMAAVVVLVIVLTELTSNTATAATFLPILGGVALGIGVSPLWLVVPATLAASFAFMLPVATPPNAVAFGSGQVSIGQMVRAGIWFNLIGIVLILLVVMFVAAPVLGIR
ncbi:MAG TPA: SLC13 family permease, partial [Actinomycetota bacterium]|nr:SLC13 family permease [Actinomycetota bacterium]